MSDPAAEARVGTVLHDKWTLERLLGEGGMGAVYAARHRNGARAAVKILSPAASRQPQIRKRFLQEGYAANRVEHPNAVKVLDDDVIADGPDEGTAYLVMELLEGESLDARAEREPPLTEHELLAIADGVLAVLEAAHAHGVVHRDLKPENLFLVGDQIKVLDFGLARLLEAKEQTIAGMAIGTATYMSPEQAMGQVENIDGRTDLYSLGAILFQLASRRRIHEAAHTLGLVVRMATTPAPKLQSVAPEVSDAFAAIVDRALAFDREHRYPDAAAMRADVQEALLPPPARRRRGRGLVALLLVSAVGLTVALAAKGNGGAGALLASASALASSTASGAHASAEVPPAAASSTIELAAVDDGGAGITDAGLADDDAGDAGDDDEDDDDDAGPTATLDAAVVPHVAPHRHEAQPPKKPKPPAKPKKPRRRRHYWR